MKLHEMHSVGKVLNNKSSVGRYLYQRAKELRANHNPWPPLWPYRKQRPTLVPSTPLPQLSQDGGGGGGVPSQADFSPNPRDASWPRDPKCRLFIVGEITRRNVIRLETMCDPWVKWHALRMSMYDRLRVYRGSAAAQANPRVSRGYEVLHVAWWCSGMFCDL